MINELIESSLAKYKVNIENVDLINSINKYNISWQFDNLVVIEPIDPVKITLQSENIYIPVFAKIEILARDTGTTLKAVCVRAIKVIENW